MKLRTMLLCGATASMMVLTSMGGVAQASVSTAPGQDKLLCFDGTTDGGFGGVCTLKANGAKGPATLDNTDSNAAGDYSGVYIASSTLNGKTLGSVTQLGYRYTGNISPNPGNLSLNVPIDENGNGTTDAYAFVDAFYCPGTAGNVDVIRDATCGIFVDSVEYASWAALVAAHPTWTVATDALAFVIAERTPAEPSALWTVSNVTLGKPGK